MNPNCRIGKVTFKDKNVALLFPKQPTPTNAEFLSMCRECVEFVKEVDGYAVVAWSKNNESVRTHYRTGSVPIFDLPNMVSEAIRWSWK